MKISIITATFNSAGTVADTLASVDAQTYHDIEHIVVDGLSRDKTLEVVGNYRKPWRRAISEKDCGIYDAMNKGIAMATGDIIGILNSDDFFESNDVLSTVAKTFAKSPDVDMIFGDVVFVRPENLGRIIRHYSSARFRPWKLRFGWMPPHPATFIRKSAYDAIGPYGMAYRIAADYEMFVRALLVNSIRFARIDKVMVRMRAGGVSTSGLRSSLALNREIVTACRSNGIYTNLALVLSKIPFKLLELVRRSESNSP